MTQGCCIALNWNPLRAIDFEDVSIGGRPCASNLVSAQINQLAGQSFDCNGDALIHLAEFSQPNEFSIDLPYVLPESLIGPDVQGRNNLLVGQSRYDEILIG